jgi:hypothetical protein
MVQCTIADAGPGTLVRGEGTSLVPERVRGVMGELFRKEQRRSKWLIGS